MSSSANSAQQLGNSTNRGGHDRDAIASKRTDQQGPGYMPGKTTMSAMQSRSAGSDDDPNPLTGSEPADRLPCRPLVAQEADDPDYFEAAEAGQATASAMKLRVVFLANAAVMAAAPPVSVGVPIRNGMPYLVQCLESIRQQSFGDNASSDDTQEVARDLVRADSRVRYIRVASDSGGSANFNRCFEHTRGGLFTWVASDDHLLPRYLELCAAHLEARPGHAIVCTSCRVY